MGRKYTIIFHKYNQIGIFGKKMYQNLDFWYKNMASGNPYVKPRDNHAHNYITGFKLAVTDPNSETGGATYIPTVSSVSKFDFFLFNFTFFCLSNFLGLLLNIVDVLP
jgi:hypothetical protein